MYNILNSLCVKFQYFAYSMRHWCVTFKAVAPEISDYLNIICRGQYSSFYECELFPWDQMITFVRESRNAF